MAEIRLKIQTPRESLSVALDDELSVGRTGEADLTIDDVGLSSVNTTFFRDGEMFFAVDENSTNGTYLNGERLGREPRRILDGDKLKLGSETIIRVESGNWKVESGETEPETQTEKEKPTKDKGQRTKDEEKTKNQKPKTKKPPFILILAAGLTFVFVIAAIIAIVLIEKFEDSPGNTNAKKTPNISATAVIPIRVIDPLGGQTPEDLQELSQLWEVQEADVEASDLQDVTISETVENQPAGLNLKVSVEFWKQQREIALAARNTPTGNDPPGTDVPRELFGDGVIKQKAKIREMQSRTPPYVLPMDFADLATKRMKGELLELPMATEDYVLEVGGSSTTGEFTDFEFGKGSTALAPGSPDYMILAQLASDFSGEKYDLTNPDHRRQMKIRLLRMFHPRAFPILEKLAKSYRQKFNRPLRVTSLQRSMEYQISLNKTNPNSFMVRGAGSLPPHTSGCAFDLARKHQTAEEQNFMMQQLAQMEREGILDALREGNLNACFHVFIYDDGNSPKM